MRRRKRGVGEQGDGGGRAQFRLAMMQIWVERRKKRGNELAYTITHSAAHTGRVDAERALCRNNNIVPGSMNKINKSKGKKMMGGEE